MPLLLLGVLLLVGWLADFGPFGRLPWWGVALPFLGAVLWWQFADSTGWTQRRAIEKMERKKAERRERAMDALGLDHRREKQVRRAREAAANRPVESPPPAGRTADPTQMDHPPESRREPRL